MKKKKIIISCMVFLVFWMMTGTLTMAGFKKMPNGKYRYYVSKTKYLRGSSDSAAPAKRWTFRHISVNGTRYTYGFDEKGYMLTGWKKLYTADKNGKSGWYTYYFDANGRMYRGRYKAGRYLKADGRMLVNGKAPDGIYRGADGMPSRAKGKSGFETTKKGTRYRQSDGTYAKKCWKCIRDPETKKQYWYYFYSTGYMAKDCMVGKHHVDAKGRKIS